MYEALEHYKVYKQKQDESAKAKQEVAPIIKQIFRKLVTDYDKVSFDEWMKDLVDKNGVTKY